MNGNAFSNPASPVSAIDPLCRPLSRSHTAWRTISTLVLALSLSICLQRTSATTLTVTSTADTGAGTLRMAIFLAQPGDTINITATGTIILASQLVITGSNITIQGPGASSLAVSGNGVWRVLKNSGTVTISGLTLCNGANAPTADFGSGVGSAGVYNMGNLTLISCVISNNDAGDASDSTCGGVGNFYGLYATSPPSLVMMNCTVSGNKAASPNGAAGGIFNNGTMILKGCTISSNSSSTYTGGLSDTGGSATLANCTISGNSGMNIGGMGQGDGTATLINCTVSGNTCQSYTGGILKNDYSGCSINLLNTIVAGNSGGTSPDISGACTSSGHNIIGDPTGVTGFTNGVNGDLVGTSSTPINPRLGALADNGGPTFTRALLAGSPALEAGNDSVTGAPFNLTIDQRGLLRLAGTHVDIGAFELQTITAPVIVAKAATLVTSTSAVLNAMVTPNGSAATVQFYLSGTTAGTPLSAGNGYAGVNVNLPVVGLTPSTTYSFYVSATSSAGVATSGTLHFTTTKPPPVAITGPATGIVYNGAMFNGTVNPNGLSTTCSFQYGLTSSYGSTTSKQLVGSGTSTIPYAAAIASLTGLTTYHFRLVAASTSGTTYGIDQTFSTPINPPPTVTTGTATAVTYQSATLNGTVNPFGLATTLYFLYGTTTAYTGTTATQSTGSGKASLAFSSKIAGLSPSTVYHFLPIAANTSGTSYGLDQVFTTANAAPTAITGTATVLNYHAVTLTGTAIPNGPSTTVWFQYGTTAAYGFTTGTQTLGSGTTALPFDSGTTITGLKGATVYHYRSVAKNSLGTTYGAGKTFTTFNPPPVVVTGGVVRTGSNGTTLNGTVNPSGLSTTAWFEYGLDTTYASGSINLPSLTNSNSTATTNVSGTLGGLAPSTTYHYRLVAVNVSGTSWGNDAAFTTAGFPVAITGTVSKTTANGTTLSGTINPCWAATTYYFEYWTPAKSGTTSKLLLASGGIGKGVSAAVIGLTATTTYSYHLVASNTNGQVTGGTLTFTTAGPPMAETGTAVSTVPGMLVSGSANADGLATTVAFQYGLTTTYGGRTVSQNAGSGRSWSPYSATIAALKSGTTYHYRIVAANSSGTVNGQDQTFTTPTSAPTVPAVIVSSTGESVAGIEATVDPHSGATNVWFQYGTTTTYGKTSGTAPLSASVPASPISVELFALLPHTIYHVRGVAKNAQGTFNSADTAFKTLPRFDMNGDGFSELLLSNTATGETSLLSIGNATVTSGTLTVTGSAAGPTLATDGTFGGQAEFNRNGTIGWVLSNSTVSQTEFWTPDAGMGGNWTSHPLVTGTFTVPDGSTVAGIGDIDGDGNPDLVITGTNQKVTFWLLNGFTVTAQKAGPILPRGYIVVGLDDLNGDGKPDLLIWQPSSGKTQVMALNGTALLSTTIGPVIPAGWQLMGVNVFTGAGTPNWLLCNPTTGVTQIWVMKGVVRSLIMTGPTIPAGFAPLGTK